ncbi:hypothetical protein DK846_08145 [Methanospirillum lacunae]|uniref:Uncharacterized protein n=1 Tax=Methanospirillum lacunae TaxID=668570 RepID=A0A2V2N636_9EURY|nr:hypothetical protein DK846_08145 [Methanospirillum lacunae]
MLVDRKLINNNIILCTNYGNCENTENREVDHEVHVSLHLKFAVPQREIVITDQGNYYILIAKIRQICIAQKSEIRLQYLILSLD